MPPAIDWSKHKHLFIPGKKAWEIAKQVPCSERVVYSRARMMGFEFKDGGLTAEERYENKTRDYLNWMRAGFPVDQRQNEGLSGC